ncbi:hypothetical protein GJAV_G00000060 [Gymnothorax javanicus]|nr:hypothetical protein GJAV_G00000060 [Gymnothorax javanicus]
MAIAYKNVLAICLFLSLMVCCNAAGGSCYAPLFNYGSECRSDTSVFGRTGHKIYYSVSVTGNAGTLVCCEAKGCNTGSASSCAPGFMKLYGIGCGHESIRGTLLWGNNVATPSIRCYGNPFGAFVSFSH